VSETTSPGSAPVSNLKLLVTYDGVQHEVRTNHSDTVAYELTATRQGWGLMGQESSGKFSYIVFLTFIAWRAMKRTKVLDVPWEVFANDVEDIDTVDRIPDPDPTQPAPEPVNG
jgi:hypothetical protein